MSEKLENLNTEPEEQKSFLRVIVHSFFIIPFLIAIFCLLFFAAIQLLTTEKKTAYDYLEDVQVGGMTKRWQGAFELSKILSHPDIRPTDDIFFEQLETAFEKSKHDDDRVRQYLALAMGQSQYKEFSPTLANSLSEESEENLPAIIYALGMLKNPEALDELYPFLEHSNARIRSGATTAIGNIRHPEAIPYLQNVLEDDEANVQWGAAISLALLKDDSGKNIVLNLLDRNYLDQFSEVDPQEKKSLMMMALEASTQIYDKDFLVAYQKMSTDKNMKVRNAAMKILESIQ